MTDLDHAVITSEEKEMIVSSLICHRPIFELPSEAMAYTKKIKILLKKLKAI